MVCLQTKIYVKHFAMRIRNEELSQKTHEDSMNMTFFKNCERHESSKKPVLQTPFKMFRMDQQGKLGNFEGYFAVTYNIMFQKTLSLG